MGRPQANNADWYPHASSMRNHRKVKALRSKFGQLQGYAFWCMMLEWLSESDGLELEFSNFECELLAGDLGVSAAEIREMIDYCLKIELLFLTSSNFIYSESLNENLSPLFEKRKRERERSKTRQRREDGTYNQNRNTTPSGVSATEMPRIKEESIKVNKEEGEEEVNPHLQLFNDVNKTDIKAIVKFIRNHKPSLFEPYQLLWNDFAIKNGFTEIKQPTISRIAKLKERVNEVPFDFIKILDNAIASDWLLENNVENRSWFTFDWIIEKDENYIKVLERKFKEKRSSLPPIENPIKKAEKQKQEREMENRIQCLYFEIVENKYPGIEKFYPGKSAMEIARDILKNNKTNLLEKIKNQLVVSGSSS